MKPFVLLRGSIPRMLRGHDGEVDRPQIEGVPGLEEDEKESEEQGSKTERLKKKGNERRKRRTEESEDKEMEENDKGVENDSEKERIQTFLIVVPGMGK